jgi:hypothetical protein
LAKRIAGTSGILLLLGLIVGSLVWGDAVTYVGPIYDGPELDYQPSIIRVEPSGQLMLVFERIDLGSFYGDFYVSFSDDNGQSWSAPQAIINSPLNERHPSLLQLDENSFVLFYLVDETGSGAYRIHRATSPEGITWTDQGAIDLGWATPGEINPNVIREADGTLTMTYHRLSAPSYIARSDDDGVTWDTLQTQVSVGNAQLPRLAKRESDGLYLVTYQVGGSDLDLYAKVSADPYDWSGPQIPVSTDINTHDSQPIVLEDGTFLVTYAKTPVNYFDVFYRASCDGLDWFEEMQVTNDPARYDTQPHSLLHETPGNLILAWSHQESVSPYQDHDVWIDSELLLSPDVQPALKMVDPEAFAPGMSLTYTLSLPTNIYCPTVAHLADAIPEGTTYQEGSLWASDGDASYDVVHDVITWTGMILLNQAVSITFQVTTASSLEDGYPVVNTGRLTNEHGTVYSLVATSTADDLPPTSYIVNPQAGQYISDTTFSISGVATDTVSEVSLVAVSVDGGSWQEAAGQTSWTFAWEDYDEGEHNLRSRASDVLGHVEEPGPGITVTVDTLPPELVATSPVSGAVGVPLSATVVLTFSEPIVSSTLRYTMEPDPGDWSETWNAAGTVVTLSHAGFEAGQTYVLAVTQARDRALNPLAPVAVSFSTEGNRRVFLPVVVGGYASAPVE